MSKRDTSNEWKSLGHVCTVAFSWVYNKCRYALTLENDYSKKCAYSNQKGHYVLKPVFYFWKNLSYVSLKRDRHQHITQNTGSSLGKF